MKIKFNPSKKKQSRKPNIKVLANKLINELIENHSYKVEGECSHIGLWVYNEAEIVISQLQDGEFKDFRCNFERKEA